MARIKLRDKEGRRKLGQAIFAAWDAAIKTNPKAPVIDRSALITSLNDILDLEDKGKSGKKIEYDFVFDTDLDANTRLVWLSIPTPETNNGGGTWDDWKRDYYDNLPPDEKEKKEEELGDAILYGCGR